MVVEGKALRLYFVLGVGAAQYGCVKPKRVHKEDLELVKEGLNWVKGWGRKKEKMPYMANAKVLRIDSKDESLHKI